MCGIVGYCNCECDNNIQALISMRDSLTHRGPDDAGVYFDDICRIGLGHRRLSVLDLSSLGHQPMSNDQGTVWMVYNGEIYNFKEIRDNLRSKGYKFKSNSDTEVVLNAYLHWGIDCVKEFIGMFAIAFWDKRNESLYLVRDRIGVKPLYYYFKDGRLLFGSELKALMAHPHFPKDIDYGVLPTFLRYGYIPAPNSIFKHTYKVKPGHYLCLQNNKLEQVKYWDVNDYYLDEPFHGDEDKIVCELEELLVDSFKYRLISDVPLGIFLSGGIDSTTLTALLQTNTNARLKTFTVGFHEDKYDEARWASRVAQYLDTDHTEYYVSVNDCLDVIEELPNIYDEPFGDNSGIPTLILSRLTQQHASVALSADGGDELFGGYKHYRTLSSINDSFLNIPKILRNKIIGTLKTLTPDRAQNVYQSLRPVLPNITDFKDKYEKYCNILSSCNDGELQNMYKNNSSKWMPDEANILLKNITGNPNKSCLEDANTALKEIDFTSQMMASDLKTFLVDDILTKVDRASMSIGLECREPFLDHRLVEYAARIPYSLKYKHGKSKYILRRILHKYVPQVLVDRPKQGFVVPLSDWLKGDLYPMLMDYLNEDKLKREGIFNEKMVSQNIENFKRGSVGENKIWYILMFQMWKDRWLST